MNVFAGVRGTGEGQKEAGSAGGEALLELTPHRMAVCHLVQVFAPPGAQQDGGPAGGPPFPFESVAHHNRLGLFLFSLTRVRTRAHASSRLLLPSHCLYCHLLLPAVLGSD
jgi:anaphase-promoting complex subunit 5